MKKRIISMLLAALMIVGMLPMTVLAAEACSHAETKVSVRTDENGVHYAVDVCTACGEEVLEQIVIDLKASVKRAAQQSFWSALPAATLRNGGAAVRVGKYYGNEETAEVGVAFNELLTWLEENEGWTMDEAVCGFVGGNGNRIYLSAEDTAAWALAHVCDTYGLSDGRSDLVLKVDIAQSGLYDLGAVISLSSDTSTDAPEGASYGAGGGGYATVIVNGETVCENYCFYGDTATQEADFGSVYLEEGSNTITFRTNQNMWGSTVSTERCNVNLCSLNLTKTASVIECGETGTETQIVMRENKTHTIKTVCTACGSEVIEETVIDLKASVKRAAQQSFWSALPAAPLRNGGSAVRVGHYSGTAESEEVTTSFNELLTWLEENEGWTLDEAACGFATGNGNRIYLSAEDTAAWALAHVCDVYGHSDGRSDLVLNVDIEEAGLYDLGAVISLSADYSTDAPEGASYGAGGGAYAAVLVNGETVCEEYYCYGEGTTELELGEVYLEAGSNTVTFHTTKNMWGSAVMTERCNVNLCSLSLSKLYGVENCTDADEDGKCDTCEAVIGECKHRSLSKDITASNDGTHTVAAECEVCEAAVLVEDVSEPNVISVDFKAFAKEAAEQPWWKALRAGGSEETKYIGRVSNDDPMTAEHLKAYNQMMDWLDANAVWNIDEEVSDLDDSLKRMFFNASDDVPWGMSWYNYYQGDLPELSKLKLTVKAAEAGWYELKLDVFKENEVYTDRLAITGTTVDSPGGGHVDVYVNGERAYRDFSFDGANERLTESVGAVYLNAGENEVILDAICSYHGFHVLAGGRFNVAVNSLTFTELNVPAVFPETNDTVAQDGYMGTNEVAATVVSSDETVATALIDENGALVITSLQEGTVTLTLSSAATEEAEAVELGKLPVRIANTAVVDCVDADDDNVCDDCGAEIPCIHASVTRIASNEEAGKHIYTYVCDICEETVKTVAVECTDVDADGYCDLCEAELPCEHTNTTSVTTANDDKTHTVTVTCECGEQISSETTACVDGDDEDTLCDTCSNELAEEVVIEKFDVAGVNMTLGNELELNIMLTKATMDAYGKDLTVTVTHHEFVDGDTDYVFNMADLPLYGGNKYYKASIRVAAAQMTDLVDVVVTDAEGNVYSNEFTTSVLTYVTNNLDKQTAKVKTLLVDMVNYGAAAQDQFSYRQDLYANSNLTDAQKLLATGDVTCTDIRVKGTNYVGSNLSLQDCILLNFMFTGVSDDVLAGMTATVEFTGVLGNEVNVTVPVEKMMNRYAGVAVNQIVLADAVTPVTVTLYNADGSVYGYATDSVESYNARQNPNGTNALYTNIMKFAASALAYKQ